MGINDAQEMLEVAQQEYAKLERQLDRERQEHEDALNAVPGFWRGSCANEDNRDDESTNLLSPVTVFAMHLDEAIDLIQEASLAASRAAEVGFPNDIRRATEQEIHDWLAETIRAEAGS